jgi:hypothetical protein
MKWLTKTSTHTNKTITTETQSADINKYSFQECLAIFLFDFGTIIWYPLLNTKQCLGLLLLLLLLFVCRHIMSLG